MGRSAENNRVVKTVVCRVAVLADAHFPTLLRVIVSELQATLEVLL